MAALSVIVVATRDSNLAPVAAACPGEFVKRADGNVLGLLLEADFSTPNRFGDWSDRVVRYTLLQVQEDLDKGSPVTVVFDWRDHLRFIAPSLRKVGIRPMYLDITGELVDVGYK